MVLVDSRGISRVPRYSGAGRKSLDCRLRGSHPLWPIVPDRSTSRRIDHSLAFKPDRSYNPTVQARWFGLFRVRSPLLAESLLFSVPPGTEMVHFPGLSSPSYGFRRRSAGITLRGLPHSEILGSKPVCGSPKLFAAYHVLHRLLAPRHSPYALSSLTIRITRRSRLTRPRPRPLADPKPDDRATRELLQHCVCCGRKKTTVCRIFSCKRASGRPAPRAGVPGATGLPELPLPATSRCQLSMESAAWRVERGRIPSAESPRVIHQPLTTPG
jgi:hypothetical protein